MAEREKRELRVQPGTRELGQQAGESSSPSQPVVTHPVASTSLADHIPDLGSGISERGVTDERMAC